MPRLYASGRYFKIVCIFLGLCFLSHNLFSQEPSGAVPDLLRMPERSEAPRYAKDVIIGELGQGTAPDEAYHLAQNILSEALTGNDDSGFGLSESLLQNLRSIKPKYYRLGGGRIETDGCVSFLLRFAGQEESIAGELFLREGRTAWFLDDLVLEEKRDLSQIRDGYRFDFTPYERFF